jgi:hypothetical protein
MSKITAICPSCEKEFETFHSELKIFCRVGCQWGWDAVSYYDDQEPAFPLESYEELMQNTINIRNARPGKIVVEDPDE